MQPLPPTREATSVEDLGAAHQHNMIQCGVCYERYRALSDAVRRRQED